MGYCGRHGRLPANFTVSFIQREMNKSKQLKTDDYCATQQLRKMSRTIIFQIYKGEKEVGNMPNLVEKE